MMKVWIKTALAGAVLAIILSGATASAQTAAAAKPPAAPQVPAAPQAPVPAVPKFPAVNPKNFTASSPTVDEVNAFLKSIWGYDENRKWSVAAIEKTAAPGVAKVVVFVGEEGQSNGASTTVFFTTPDGKHAIAGQVIDFGARPFAVNRKLLQDEAAGAARGAASKDLMLVEFADLQCPHCKEAQDTMNNLVHDFPTARIVYENFPIAEVHPFAFRAAAEGECVRKAKGDAAFFTYAQAVYDKQASLTKELADATLDAAATAAGTDPKAMAACALTPAAKADVDASVALGAEVGVDQTPLLFVNGHALPINSLTYETLKKIIVFQAAQDGITVQAPPTLSTLK